VQREFNRRIFERFRELGIEMANPRASLLLPMGAAAPQAAGAFDERAGNTSSGTPSGTTSSVANPEGADRGQPGSGAVSPTAQGPHAPISTP